MTEEKSVLATAVVETSFIPKKQGEGVGAKVRRIIGNRKIRFLDPFLMLDFFEVKLPAGFPDHPHRGFETVTYLIEGKMYHEDFRGHKGALTPGAVQWMTAGKGIVHAEIPGSFEKNALGFQLWINLFKKDKLCDPRYQEFNSNDIPEIKMNGITAKVISGNVFDTKGIIEAATPAHYIDFTLEDNEYKHTIPKGWNAMIFVYKGTPTINGKQYDSMNALFFKQNENSDSEVTISVTSGSVSFVWISGLPIKEEVCQAGPFVMNSRKEIEEAYLDYYNQRNGFEERGGWNSKIKYLMHGENKEIREYMEGKKRYNKNNKNIIIINNR